MAATSGVLATKWEALRRVRNRFKQGVEWIKFPETYEKEKKKNDDDDDDCNEPHKVSTGALGLKRPDAFDDGKALQSLRRQEDCHQEG